MDVLAITGLSATATSMLAIGYTIMKRYYQKMSNIRSVTYSETSEDDKEPILSRLIGSITSAPKEPKTEVSQV